MNRTLKALGLGLLAALAVSAFAVVGASANITAHTGGHFVLNSGTSATLHGHGGPGLPHQLKLHLPALDSTIECTETHTGSVTTQTSTSITITTHHTNCPNGRIVHTNGCKTTFTIRDTSASTLHNAMHITCPVGKKKEITAPGECTITIGPQTVTNAFVYTNVLETGVHAITAHLTAKGIVYEKHGLCEFLSPFGTGPHTGAEMTGTMVWHASQNGSPIGITATGRNGH